MPTLLEGQDEGLLNISCIRFCKTLQINADQALKAYEAKRFKAYLLWRVQYSRAKKESTIITYWKVLSMVYTWSTSRYINEGILYDMKNV